MEGNLAFMAKKWPSAIVAREEVGSFTGGVLSPKYMANLDSAGKGPSSFRIGKKIAYPVDGLIAWLESRGKNN